MRRRAGRHLLVLRVDVAVFLEAVNNAVRQASAKHIEILVREGSNSMTLQVRDDACGIPTPYISGGRIGSMRKRIEALGGTFRIEPESSGGSRVFCRDTSSGLRH
jgi:signal transduction histidine kinase